MSAQPNAWLPNGAQQKIARNTLAQTKLEFDSGVAEDLCRSFAAVAPVRERRQTVCSSQYPKRKSKTCRGLTTYRAMVRTPFFKPSQFCTFLGR